MGAAAVRVGVRLSGRRRARESAAMPAAVPSRSRSTADSAARLDRPRRGAARDTGESARDRSQDREVSRQGPHGGRRRRGRCSRCCIRWRSKRHRPAGGRGAPVLRDDRRRLSGRARFRSTPRGARAGVEVLEIIDRGVETGFLAPAPDERRVHVVRLPARVRTDGRTPRQPHASRPSRWPISSRCGGSHERRAALRDQRDRDLIRDGLDDTVIVEAAAGTGKTTELVQRILQRARRRAARASSRSSPSRSPRRRRAS